MSGSDSMDKGLAAAFGKSAEPQASSVLSALQARTTSKLGLILEAEEPEGAPVLVTDAVKELRDPSGRYQILGEIGRGGVGVVYKGRDQDLGRDVAMKVLKDEYAAKPDVLARFVEEAQIGGQLQHPGIVPVYELGLQAGERPYIAMKLVKGETLAVHLSRRDDHTRGRRQLLGNFEQVCQTIAYAHARRVVHRDLKPTNVMIGAFGEVQVVDWGFAKVLPKGGVADEAQSAAGAAERSVIETVRSQPGSGSHSVAESMLGTPSYMPPEQALGDIGRVDRRSDVFALGAILCEILTGEPPYREAEGDLVRQAAAAALDGARERLAQCGANPALITLCTECMSPARRARPASAAELAERIGDYLTSVEERARHAEVRAAEARYKHRVTLLSAAAALVILALGAGTWIWAEQTAQQHRVEANQRVAAAMSEASGARGKAQAGELNLALWTTALQSATQLATHAAEDGVDAGARSAAQRILADVQKDSDEAHTEVARRDRDTTMLARLETLRIPTEDNLTDPSWFQLRRAKLDTGYRQAFTAYLGQPLLSQATEQVIAALQTGDIEVELAASLDHWAIVRDFRGELEEANVNPAGTARMREIAARIDSSDSWRMQLRDLLPDASEKKDQLLALAKSANFASLTPTACRNLVIGLSQAGERDAALQAIQRAQEAHSGDFEICFQLAIFHVFARPTRPAEAVKTLRIAHALRPKHAEVLHRQGVLLSDLGRYKAAERTLRRLDALQPDNGHWLRHLAYAVMRQGRPGDALAIYDEALSLTPRDSMGHTQKGLVLEELDRRPEAMKSYETAIGIKPRESDAWTNLGTMHWEDGNLEKAIECHENALEVLPDYPPYNNNIGVALMAQGKLPEAIKRLEKACLGQPTNAPFLTNLGDALWKHGKTVDAQARFEEAVQADENFARGHYKLGGLLAKLGKYKEAVKRLRRASELDEDDPMYHSDLGLALQESGKLAGALVSYNKALQLDPNLAPAHINKGQLYLRQNNLPGARKSYANAAKHFATDTSEFGRKWLPIARGRVDFVDGQILMSKGELPKAIECLGRALNAEPDSPGTNGALGAALFKIGKPDKAIPYLKRALRGVHDETGALVNLGNAFRATGNVREAMRYYQAALRSDPNYNAALLMKGQAHVILGEPGKASECFRKSLEIDPRNALAHYMLGDTQRRAGDFEKAVKSLEDAIRLNSQLTEAYVLLGIALTRRNRLDDAIVCYGKGLKVAARKGQLLFEGQLHYNLGSTLQAGGRTSDAIDSYRAAERTFAKLSSNFGRTWQPKAARRADYLTERANRDAALVEEIVVGRKRVATSAKEWSDAISAGYDQKRYREVVALTEITLRDQPGLTQGTGYGLYNAACTAALHAADAKAQITADERTRLRKLARAWLVRDGEHRAKTVENGVKTAAWLRGKMRHRLADPDFTSVRGDGLQQLPEAERKAWQALWTEIEKAGEEKR